MDMNDFFSDDDHYTGPPLTEEMVTKAQQTLGYLLPATYLDLIRGTNGGCPVRCCFRRSARQPLGTMGRIQYRYELS